MRGKERLRDRVQANVFSDEAHGVATGRPQKISVEGVAVSDLKALASRFLKPSAVDNALERSQIELALTLHHLLQRIGGLSKKQNDYYQARWGRHPRGWCLGRPSQSQTYR